MTRIRTLLPIALAAVAAAPAAAVPGGDLSVLPIGVYECSEPGEKPGDPWVAIPARGFSIANGSTYETRKGRGSYLLLGTHVTFTTGPMRGQEFELKGSSVLQKLRRDDRPADMRCIRRVNSG